MRPQHRVKRVAVLGPSGAGEKATVLSLFHALFIRPVVTDVAYPILSADLRAELGSRRGLRKPDPKPAKELDLPRRLTFDWADGQGGCAVEVVALPAAAMYPDGRVDSRRLAAWLTSEGYDLAVIVLNPHTLWAELGRPAFHRVLLRYMALGRKAEASAYTLAEATALAGEAVFGLDADGFRALNVGWDALPEAIRNLRFTQPHRTRTLEKVLEVEGAAADDAAEYARVLDLIVQAACGETGELAIVRDLLKMPHTILGLTHFDIGESSGLTRPEYERHADALLPDDRERFRKDIVFLKNVHVEMQPPPLEAVYVRDVRPDGGLALWEAAKLHLRAVPGVAPAAAPRPVEAPEPTFAWAEEEVETPPTPTPAAPTFAADLQLPPPPPTPAAKALAWVANHPGRVFGAVGGVLVTILAFVAGGPVVGVCVMLALWAAAAVAVLAPPMPTRRPAVPPVIAARVKPDFETLRNGHAH